MQNDTRMQEAGIDVLYHGELVVPEEEGYESLTLESAPSDLVTKGRSLPGRSGAIPARAGQASRFSVGVPVVYPLESILQREQATIPAEIQEQMARHEFYWVRLACSFDPARGCHFSSARFLIQLETLAKGRSSVPLISLAMAYDLFPAIVEDELNVQTSINVTPKLQFTCNPLDVALTLPSYEQSSSGTTYTGRIRAFDLQGWEPGWSFTRTNSHEIAGIHKLYMLVRKPKRATVTAHFSLSAEIVEAGSGLQILAARFRRATTNAIVEMPTYQIC